MAEGMLENGKRRRSIRNNGTSIPANCNKGMDSTVDKFDDEVQRIVLRVAMHEAHEGNDAGYTPQESSVQGPLTPRELTKLSMLCAMESSLPQTDSSVNNPQGFASVEGEQLAALIELLDKQVKIGCGIHIIESCLEVMGKAGSPSRASAAFKDWMGSHELGGCHEKITSLKLGLEASSIILFIATCPGVDQRAINQDAIESCISLMRVNLCKNLVPSFNETGHLMNRDSKDGTRHSPVRKRRRSSTAGGGYGAKELKEVYKHVVSTIKEQLVLMDRLEQLVQKVSLDDQQILMLTSGSLSALEIDYPISAAQNQCTSRRAVPILPAQQLQTSCIALVAAAFNKYPMHRDSIIEDLFPLMLRVPSGKRSLRAFPVRYSSAPSPRCLVRLNDCIVTDLLSQNNTNRDNKEYSHHIQMMTAMILTLVQSCVNRPTYDEVVVQEEGSNKPKKVAQFESGLRDCHVVSNSFVEQLLRRCSKPKDAGASEFRPILCNLVEDLLLVLLIPEYPASEILLLSMSRHLNSDLQKASQALSKPSSGKDAPEVTYLNAAFDMLGRICYAQARILATTRDKPLNITDMSKPQNDSASSRIDCYCGKNSKDDIFMVQCDNCGIYQHGSCVDVNDENLPEEWFCDACRLGRIAQRERRGHKLSGKDALFVIDDTFTLQHSFLSSLSHRLGVPQIEPATQFHIARWIDQLEHKTSDSSSYQKSARKIVDNLLDHWAASGPSADDLTEEGSTRAILALAAKASPLIKSFRPQISFLLKLMSDEATPSLRKSSLKTIDKTMEGDPQLMLLPIITRAVSRRLSDEAISVREAAVALVGSYVVNSPAVASTFHPSLLACLKDVGVSVRKRTVRIFQDILTSNPTYRGRSAACDVMLQLAADPKEEDSVRDLVHDMFAKLWLEDGESAIAELGNSRQPGNSDEAGHGASDGEAASPTNNHDAVAHLPGVVTPTPPAVDIGQTKHSGSRVRTRSDVAATQMMEVVRSAGTSAHLEHLLKTLLEGPTDSGKGRKSVEKEKKRRQEVSHKECEKRVDSLFELLISIEEQRDSRRDRVGKDLGATLQTIAVFAGVVPQSAARHLDTILPYLKADNGVSSQDEAAIVTAGCRIFYRISSVLDKIAIQRLASGCLAKDLVQITYKFGPGSLAEAVRTLSALAHHPDAMDSSSFSEKLLELARMFYGFLVRKLPIHDFSSCDQNERSNINRAMAVLGIICRHHGDSVESWEEEVDNEAGVLPATELSLSNLTFLAYRVLSKYLEKRDVSTKCNALRALGGIFVAQPRLLFELEKHGLIDDVMSKKADVLLQIEALHCWGLILLAEEKRIDGGQATNKMESDETITVSKHIEGDQDGNATLFGGVLTSHAERIFTMTSARDRQLRHAAVELLGTLLRQGLVNPNETVPHLLALQGDVDNSPTRSLALRLLMTEGERRPEMLRQRICAGVKQAYNFQRAVYPKKKTVSALISVQHGRTAETECVFAKVYTECVTRSRKQRHGLFRNLLGLFERAQDLEKSKFKRRRSKRGVTERKADLALLSFTSQILAYLPYTASGDLLYIIHHITGVVALQGVQILDLLAATLRPVGISSSDELDEINASEDALEVAARSKFPSRTQQSQALTSKTFDLDRFVQLCEDGTALVLLLRLKSFLKELYNLSETRILEYDPEAKEKIGDRGISKADFSKPFDASVHSTSRKSGKARAAVDLDSLIRNYAEFRRLMRMESVVDDRKDEVETREEVENGETVGQKRKSDDMEAQEDEASN